MGSRGGQISSSDGSSSNSIFTVDGEVLRWAVIAAAADDDEIPIPSSLPDTQQLPPYCYDDPEQFAQMQSTLLAHEVFSQYRGALEKILHSTSSVDSARILKLSFQEGVNINTTGGGTTATPLPLLSIRIPGRNSGTHSVEVPE
jgi:hypothetical protein